MRVRNAREPERASGERGNRESSGQRKGLSAYSYFVAYGMQKQRTAYGEKAER